MCHAIIGYTMACAAKRMINLKCIGAIHTEFTTKKGTSSEWHYYISSRQLTIEELLYHARMKWSFESMHF